MRNVWKILLICLAAVVVIAAAALFILRARIRNQIMDGPGMVREDDGLLDALQGEWVTGDYATRVIIEDFVFKLKYRDTYLAEGTIPFPAADANPVDRYELELRGTDVCEGGQKTGSITELYHEAGKLYVTIHYDFGIDRTTVFEKSDKPEFWYYDRVDEEYLPQLQGTWICGRSGIVIEDSTAVFTFDGEELERVEFIVIRENNSSMYRVYLANPNLYDTSLGAYAWPEYREGKIFAAMMVMDAAPVTEEYTKVEP